MKYKKNHGEKQVDVIGSVAESLIAISNKVIDDYTYYMSDLDTELLTKCVSKNMFFNSSDELRVALMREARLRVAEQVADKVSPKIFDNGTVLIDYPQMLKFMLQGDFPEYHVITSNIKDKDIYLLIDHLIWDAYWQNKMRGDDLNDDDEPYDGGPNGDEPYVGDLPF